MRIANCFCDDRTNLGDQSCCPADSLAFSPHTIVKRDFRVPPEEWNEDALIVGGGGLFHIHAEDQIKALTDHFVSLGRPVFGWGLGTNRDFIYPSTLESRKHVWPDWMDRWTIIGLRDFAVFDSTMPKSLFVPCASCMRPEFAETPPAGTGTVIYEHHGNPVLLDYPRMNNSHTNFGEVIKFLSSAFQVITSTFHGAYWSLLLGKRVVLWKPSSNRFFTALPPLPIADEDNAQAAIAQSLCFTTDPIYRDDCRLMQLQMRDLVLNALESK